jgi:hypothetical protein
MLRRLVNWLRRPRRKWRIDERGLERERERMRPLAERNLRDRGFGDPL